MNKEEKRKWSERIEGNVVEARKKKRGGRRQKKQKKKERFK